LSGCRHKIVGRKLFRGEGAIERPRSRNRTIKTPFLLAVADQGAQWTMDSNPGLNLKNGHCIKGPA